MQHQEAIFKALDASLELERHREEVHHCHDDVTSFIECPVCSQLVGQVESLVRFLEQEATLQ